jgi:hypothetical protein
MTLYADLVQVLSGEKIPVYRITAIALAALIEREAKKHEVDPLKVVETLHEISKRCTPIDQLSMVRNAAKDLAYEKGQQTLEELQAEQASFGSTLAFANSCLEKGVASLRDSVAKAAAGDQEGAEEAHRLAVSEFDRCDRAVTLAESVYG